MSRIRASVIVVVHAGAAHLDDSLASLAVYAGQPSVEVVLVDNGSPDRCGELARRRFPWARVVRSEHNLGFTGGVHLGVEASSGEILLLLNDDAAAEPGWVEAHLELLARHPEAAATAGRLTSWDGAAHDFLRGAVAFDLHAFQVGQGWPVAERPLPAAAEPLPFACGGNLAIRRQDWQLSGGFDQDLFAYFEDVELGWRLWALGREVVAAPAAVARHRGAGTSAQLGCFRRGVLFERNAMQVFFSTADAEHRAALGNAVLATFLHRMVAFAEARPELAAVTADPFGTPPPVPARRERWQQRWREGGLRGVVRHALARLLLGPDAGGPRLGDGLLLMQLRAANGLLGGGRGGLDRALQRAAELAKQRRYCDRDLMARFPRLIVPTYAGDEQWFASAAFQQLLPEGWPLEQHQLQELLHPSLLA